MPFIVICGQPCSGKSTVAAQLAAVLRDSGLEVALLDEPSLHLTRNSAYKDVRSEKETRGKLKSAAERVANKSKATIVDSLNNIKGYRYELWCIARAAGTRYCMVHVDTAAEVCRQWNAGREEGERYSDAIFEDLACRFERPDSRQRWDAPLFTIKPAGDPQEASEVLQAVVAAMTEAQPNPHTAVARELQPTFATSNPTLLGTNTLHEIDQAAQDVVDEVMEAAQASAGGPPGLVRFRCDPQAALQLDRAVTLAELRRHKRAFLKLATKVTFARLQDCQAARRLFIDYLRQNLGNAF